MLHHRSVRVRLEHHDPLRCGFAKLCAFDIFKEKTTQETLHEENDQVYKITILNGNYVK